MMRGAVAGACREIRTELSGFPHFSYASFLRLIIALGSQPRVITEVFRALYANGADPDSEEVWLCSRLDVFDPAAWVEDLSVKSELRETRIGRRKPVYSASQRCCWTQSCSGEWTRCRCCAHILPTRVSSPDPRCSGPRRCA